MQRMDFQVQTHPKRNNSGIHLKDVANFITIAFANDAEGGMHNLADSIPASQLMQKNSSMNF